MIAPDLEKLRAVRFVDADGNATVLGLLVLGKDPASHLACAYVEFVRFDGSELTDPIVDRREISAPMPELMRQIDQILAGNIRRSTDFVRREREVVEPDYPLESLQQLVRNAVMHRVYEGTNAPIRVYWFSDRVEVHSPGGPYGIVDAGNFGSGVTDYRNPLLAAALSSLGYVQRFGVGIAVARRELERNGNPALEFEVESTVVLALVRSH